MKTTPAPSPSHIPTNCCLLLSLLSGLLPPTARADGDGEPAPAAGQQADRSWSQWRGPFATGEAAPGANPPVEWSESKNIRWKTGLPGAGHSSPVVWGDRIYLTTAIPYGDELPAKFSGRPGAHDNVPVKRKHESVVLAINRPDGKILWRKTVNRGLPHEGGHMTGTLASASPITDGGHVYAFFGSRGLYCLDADGKLVWQSDLGEMFTKHGHGEGSSPVLHGNTLVVNWDHEEESFVAAFDKQDGRQLWKAARDEASSWASPIVVEHKGKPQLVVSGTRRVRGYDLATGKLIWECGGLSANVVASPVAADGFVYAGSSYNKRSMVAIRLDGARGDITGTDQVIWTRTKRTPYVPSPLLYKGSLYFLMHYQGVLTKADIKTGLDQGGPYRLAGLRDIYASPVAAANRIYITDRSGVTVVISHTEEPEILARNQLDDTLSASPAIVGDEIILRGEKFLYAIGEE